MNFKESLVIVLMGVFVMFTDAKADRVDVIENMSDMDYCSVVADQFYAGALAQIGGSARKLTALTPVVVEMLEHGMPIPKDAMYVPEFDSLTDREKSWMATNVLLGYDEAAKVKATDEQAKKMTQTLFESCMYKRTAQKRTEAKPVIPRMQMVASSEGLTRRIQECRELLRDQLYIGDAMMNNIPKRLVVQKAQNASNLTTEHKLEVLKLIDEAYSSPDPAAWVSNAWDACVDGAR